jgi:hypothetical protein
MTRKTTPGKKQKKATTRKRRAKRVGARGLISRQRIQCIAKKIRGGNYAHIAAQLCGISKSSYWAWLERGEEELNRILEVEQSTGKAEKPRETELLYLEFLEEIHLSDAHIEDYAVKNVKNGLRDPDIAMKFLGLRFKERWSRLQQHELSGAGGGPIIHEVRRTIVDGEKSKDDLR